jgi:hypothetical protein
MFCGSGLSVRRTCAVLLPALPEGKHALRLESQHSIASSSSQRYELRSPQVLQSLGFLFDAYSRPAYLFEVVEMGSKLFLT